MKEGEAGKRDIHNTPECSGEQIAQIRCRNIGSPLHRLTRQHISQSRTCSGPSATAYPKLVNVESDGKSAPCCVAPMTWAQDKVLDKDPERLYARDTARPETSTNTRFRSVG